MKALLLSLCLSASVSTSAFLPPVKNAISNTNLGLIQTNSNITKNTINGDITNQYTQATGTFDNTSNNGYDFTIDEGCKIFTQITEEQDYTEITYIKETIIYIPTNKTIIYGGITTQNNLEFYGWATNYNISETATIFYSNEDITTNATQNSTIEQALTEYNTIKNKPNTHIMVNAETTNYTRGSSVIGHPENLYLNSHSIEINATKKVRVYEIRQYTIYGTQQETIQYTQNMYIRNTFTLYGQLSVDTTITTYEVIDIPGLVLTILVMPFTFVSKAFGDFTLFPGTIYQVNIGNLILIILLATLIMFIIKKFK